MAEPSAVAPPGPSCPTRTLLLDDVCASPPAWPSDVRRAGTAMPGDRLGRFIIKGVLGEGGMSVVYDAFDPQLERAVALKQVKLAAVRGPYQPLAEARALARLNHPNVVTIYELVKDETHGLLALEKIDGITLRTWLAEQRRTTDEILHVLLEAASGLAAAHAAGVIHRDFKPDNVLVGRDGRVRITDFGLAMSISSREPATPAGTRGYVAPEQARGEAPDARSDQFSFGVTLAEALSGDGARPPRAVRAVIDRATQPCCEARFPSMTALRAALARAAESRTARRWLAPSPGRLANR
jgi:eukaryotic-like serine/threonine-protein kinase